MGEQGGPVPGEQVLELINVQMQPGEIGKIAVAQIIVVHKSVKKKMSVFFLRPFPIARLRLGNPPNKHAERLCIRHMHQQRAHHKPQALAIPDFGIVQTEAL